MSSDLSLDASISRSDNRWFDPRGVHQPPRDVRVCDSVPPAAASARRGNRYMKRDVKIRLPCSHVAMSNRPHRRSACGVNVCVVPPTHLLVHASGPALTWRRPSVW